MLAIKFLVDWLGCFGDIGIEKFNEVTVIGAICNTFKDAIVADDTWDAFMDEMVIGSYMYVGYRYIGI